MLTTKPFTTCTLQLLTMIETTFDVRLQQLIKELETHPHREEILNLALSQMADDCNEVQLHAL